MVNSRRYNWGHCALLGSASRWGPDLRMIRNARSATPRAKELVAEIEALQRTLYLELKHARVNEDGSITHFPTEETS